MTTPAAAPRDEVEVAEVARVYLVTLKFNAAYDATVVRYGEVTFQITTTATHYACEQARNLLQAAFGKVNIHEEYIR